MAFFDRADERDQLILCNICNVKCAERSIVNHRNNCKDRNADKFRKGALLKCEYDTSHIVEAGKMELHLEFCNKRQTELLSEFQLVTGNTAPVLGEPSWSSGDPSAHEVDDEWNRKATDKCFVKQMSKLKL